MPSTRTRVDLSGLRVLDDLPSPPVVAMEILRLGRDPDTGLDELAEVLSRDPALAGKVIRIANAAAYRRRGEVVSVADAATRLGLRTLEVISLGFSLVRDLPKNGSLAGMNLDEFWRRSLTTAVMARRLAAEHLPGAAQEAFISGLFAHLGRMVLAERATRAYEPVAVAGQGWPSAGQEIDALGFSNLDVSAALLQAWELPKVLVDTAGHLAEADTDPDLARLVSLAMAADEFLARPEQPGAAVALDEAVAAALGGNATSEQVLEGSAEDISEACAVFDVEAGSVADPQQMLEDSRNALIDASLLLAEDLESEERRSQALVREVQELEERVREDSLTRLPNRAALDEFLAAGTASTRSAYC